MINIDELKAKANSPNSVSPRPFLRWAGSKRYLLKYLVNYIPEKFGTYFEPFLGSGSMYFLLNPTKAIISDTATELIDTYCAVKSDPKRVFCHLSKLDNNKENYYYIRANRSSDFHQKAAEFIFLNKTCWNGLYRVNASGVFNVPYGYVKTKELIDENNLFECSKTLSKEGVALKRCDFEDNLSSCVEGDLVYLDPPYVTGHNNNGFVSYNESIFSWNDQIRLSEIAHELVKKGVSVIVSNANHDDVIKLYNGFRKSVIERNSTIASDINRRGKISEVIFTTNQIKV